MKVFNKEKFLDNYSDFYFEFILSQYGENNWVNLCNGKTEDEIKMLGYAPIEDCMIEKGD